ncbi:hypothetical protein SLEP1_g15087 [Rubroshorea leprosula]|uniref:Uncharacterized protein n=1 Tax=Rubroshorea leprosula TaxID=152421 RepID=A0AAV5IVS1_9ROSI|nr:hypothetical protein SLEP1_g15087 [Rubroshorea leprosula]
MSSEGTMSVVGSEVMPLDYGSMDSESSPSPTNSERTVEERKDERVRGYVSELGNRSSLRGLAENYNLPHHVLIRLAGVNEQACSAPRDHWMPLVGGRGEKGWYYFGPRSSSKGNKSLFSAGPSSIKGWKEKFFFVDDTEWSRRDAEVEQLSAWKAKKTKQNNYKLNEDEVEEVEKLVREEGDVVDILYLTSPKAIEAAELYGPSSLSEAEMDEFINVAGGLRIPKKPRKKSKTSTATDKGVAEKERLLSTSARVLEIQQRPEPARGDSKEVSEEVAPLQRKKRKVAEPEARGDEVVEFVPRPFPPKIDPEKSLFEETNTTGAKRFLDATLPEVDRRQAKQEAVSHLGARVVKRTLESASWVNALAQEYAEIVKDCTNWQRQCEALRKEKEELQKEKEELQKKNKQMQRRLDEVVPTVTELQSDRESLSTRLVFEERKRKICEDKLDAQDKYVEKMNQRMVELKKNVELLVHNRMEGHISNFLNSNTFENILKLYRLPTAILAFIDCRKKVKAQYPEVDVTTVTFGEQEEGVEEDGESLSIDFRPQITLRWERDAEGRTIFPLTFDVELVAVEGKEEEEEQVQQLAPPEAEVPPLPAGDEPRSPPLPLEEQPPPPAE